MLLYYYYHYYLYRYHCCLFFLYLAFNTYTHTTHIIWPLNHKEINIFYPIPTLPCSRTTAHGKQWLVLIVALMMVVMMVAIIEKDNHNRVSNNEFHLMGQLLFLSPFSFHLSLCPVILVPSTTFLFCFTNIFIIIL